jgi:hypothetical protein
MTKNKPISLSDSSTLVMKYFTPVLILLFTSIWISQYKEYLIALFFAFIGLLYWYVRIVPLKEVKFIDNFLIISNDFKKDNVSIDNIEKLVIGKWSMYRTIIYFKQPTKFGMEITFITMQASFGFGISDRVKIIFKQIQDNIDCKNIYPEGLLIDKDNNNVR